MPCLIFNSDNADHGICEQLTRNKRVIAMKTSIHFGRAVLLAAAAIVVTSLAEAHHSFAMFDRSREEVMTGMVARWAFNSPHAALYIETPAGQLWAFEGAAPASLIGRNMTGFTFQPGDPVTVVVCPLRDGRKGGALGYVIKAGDEEDFEAWFRPNDGGCGPSRDWGEWMQAGYKSRAEAEQALGIEREDPPGPRL
jgi:hypothetical protein